MSTVPIVLRGEDISATLGANPSSASSASTKSINVFREFHLDEVDKVGDASKDIDEALDSDTFMSELRSFNARVYSGGVNVIIPEVLHGICGQRYFSTSINEESQVMEIRERCTLPCGGSVVAVVAMGLLTNKLTCDFVVPAGQILRGYSPSASGSYRLTKGEDSAIVKPRLLQFALTPGLPRKPSRGALQELRFKWRKFSHNLHNLIHFSEDISYVYTVDCELFTYLHQQRLGTSASIDSSSMTRIIEAASIKRVKDQITAETIKTTDGYFTTHFARSNSPTLAASCLIKYKQDFPALVEPTIDTAIYAVGTGWINTSYDNKIEVEVVDNGNLEVLLAKDVTYEDGRIRFHTSFAIGTPQWFYGGAPAVGSDKASIKSTFNLQQAFLRLSNSRKNEVLYRLNADYLLMKILDYPRPDRNIRQRAARYGAFGSWGLSHNKFIEFSRLMNDNSTNVIKLVDRMFRTILDELLVTGIDPAYLHEINNLTEVQKKFDFAHRIHPKQAERLLALSAMIQEPRKLDPSTEVNEGKVKYEVGKAGKLPRVFTSLGPMKVLEQPLVPEALKKLMSEEVEIQVHNCKDLCVDELHIKFFAQPSQDEMDEWARQVWNQEGYVRPEGQEGREHHVYLNYHSDDSHMSMIVNIGKRHYRMNLCVDIAKCDLSHSPGLFLLVQKVMNDLGMPVELTDLLFAQLRCNVRFMHPNRKIDEFIIFKLNNLVLLSGSVLTTVVNNFASLLILLCIYANVRRHNFTDENMLTSTIIESAALAGYEVTIDALTLLPLCNSGLVESVGNNVLDTLNEMLSKRKFERQLEEYKENNYPKLTFLKHFPFVVGDQAYAFKDLATLIRGLGISDDQVDCLTRLREIVLGWQFSYDSSLLDVVFKAVELEKPKQQIAIPHNFLEARYDCAIQSLADGLHLLFRARSAMFIAHEGLDAILKVGYGLTRLRVEVSGPCFYDGTELTALGTDEVVV